MGEKNRGLLERLFGPFASVRILDFLSTFREFDYSMADIARNTGLSSKTIQREMPRLISYRVIEMSRSVGRAQMYRLNAKDPIAVKLNSLISEIARLDSEKLMAEDLETIPPEADREKIVATL